MCGLRARACPRAATIGKPKTERMKTKVFSVVLCALLAAFSCRSGNGTPTNDDGGDEGEEGRSGVSSPVVADQHILRAMDIVDAAFPAYFAGPEMLLSEYYNPYTKQVSGTGGSDASIWKYTSAIEAVNAVLHGLIAHREGGNATLYDDNFQRYADLLERLYENASYYKGTYTLTSFTQTREWSVYAVPRGDYPGGANRGGDNHKYNVYGDQMCFVRELIESYKATGNEEYLAEAEYLTEYVLDGWDCTLDENGVENGGIPWGPGYVTKHSCSNGPIVSPLVWLHEIYKGRDDEITYGYIEGDGSRATRSMKKSDLYLHFAQKIYEWQNVKLRSPEGVYYDMMGGCDAGSGGQGCDPRYETVGDVTYRAGSRLTRSEGTRHTYNAGAMLSGACDLYRATGRESYRTDIEELTAASFNHFAQRDATLTGYCSWSPSLSTWSPWFNGVLFRGFADACEVQCEEAAACVESFRQNLDHGYENFYHEGFIPVNLLAGWSTATDNNRVNVMCTCAYAAEYARLARHELIQQ